MFKVVTGSFALSWCVLFILNCNILSAKNEITYHPCETLSQITHPVATLTLLFVVEKGFSLPYQLYFFYKEETLTL